MISAAIENTPKKVINPNMAILPHSGLIYSIRSMAHLITSFDKPVKYVILLSPSHYFPLQNNTFYQSTFSSYETPYQEIENLPVSLDFPIKKNQEAFALEHGVEMVLPILGYMQERQREKMFLSMFLVSHLFDPEITLSFSQALIQSLEQCNICLDEVLCIASSDFTHYGKNYHHTPYDSISTSHLLHQIQEGDYSVIDDLIAYRHSKRSIYPCNACGYGAMSSISQLAKLLDCHGEIIDYYPSSDISQDSDHIVSYATVFFKENQHELK
jgi:AmmeMemoRadiSam system protein B